MAHLETEHRHKYDNENSVETDRRQVKPLMGYSGERAGDDLKLDLQQVNIPGWSPLRKL